MIDAHTGEVRVTPEPKRTRRTHLASRMEELYTPPAQPTVPVWSHEQLEGEGPLRWRRRLRRENRDYVIVFVGHQYGIFHASELLVLSGVPVRELPPHLGSRDDICAVMATCPCLTPQSIVRPQPKNRYVLYRNFSCSNLRGMKSTQNCGTALNLNQLASSCLFDLARWIVVLKQGYLCIQ